MAFEITNRVKRRDADQHKTMTKKDKRKKLTSKQVKEIRSKYIPWKYSTRKLGKEYSISGRNVRYIISGLIWK